MADVVENRFPKFSSAVQKGVQVEIFGAQWHKGSIGDRAVVYWRLEAVRSSTNTVDWQQEKQQGKMSRKGKIEAVRSGATKSKGHGKELAAGSLIATWE